MKKGITGIILLIVLLFVTSCSEKRVNSLTYAVFPYLPDVGYYQEIIENRWAEIEPDIKLVRKEWDCYSGEAPDGIDVIFFDAVTLDKIIDNGWIQPIDTEAVSEIEDFFPFSLEGLSVNGRLYGIPVFLCGNFLIYDQDCEPLVNAEHITDIADMSEVLVVNSEVPSNRHQYTIEVLADTLGEANPSSDNKTEDSMLLIDRLAIDSHKHDKDTQVVMTYDSGVGLGYIGFSESMRLLKDRREKTQIKTISFSDRENIFRLYVDAAAVTAGVEGERYEKCLELMNLMADADVLKTLSVQEGAPQYLMLARKTPYQELVHRFPIYAQLEKLSSDERNKTILTP